VPVLEALGRDGRAPLRALSGVLNGTANFVLEQCELGRSLEAAVAEARARGLAEADPSRDLDGRDAAAKLCTVALLQGGPPLREDEVDCEPITAATLRPGLRQVASLERSADGWRARVTLECPSSNSLLRLARGEQNVVVLHRTDGSRECLLGSGAGRWPTAEAVVGDLLQLARERALLANAAAPCYAGENRGG
jgi:homoserine dehydrogenase